MESIRIRGARQHNLRGIDVEIPRGKLVVVTGPSGSGKSSLAFHTLFAEGQRRFVESLSAYARQFLDQLEKPDVDAIDGLSPAIAIEQRGGGLNPRSTVATVTEIHEHLRVLWAAAGVPHDPATSEKLERMGASDIVTAISSMEEGTKVVLLAPVPEEESREPERLIGDLRRQGFVRVRVEGEILELEEAAKLWPERARKVEVVVDRLVVKAGGEARLADSVEMALRICANEAKALVSGGAGLEDGAWREISFQTSYRNPKTGFMMGELSPRHFSFNSHLGACPACEGLGTERFCDPDLLLGGVDLPLAKGGVKGWWKVGSQRGKVLAREMVGILRGLGLSEDAVFADLPDEGRRLLFEGGLLEGAGKSSGDGKKGTKKFEGLCIEAERKLREARSEAVRRRLLRVMAERPCRVCEGRRLRPEILAVRIEGAGGLWLGIQDFCGLPVEEAEDWLAGLRLPEDRAEVCGQLSGAVRERLGFLREVGLGYLGLDRSSATLSGGEAQRIRLATQLGIGLTGVLYVLDEPSIGLHAEDTGKLIAALKRLRDRGNTVVVVEHDEEMIRAADWMIELGPGAGVEGGMLLGSGRLEDFPSESPTRRWLESSVGESVGGASFPHAGDALVVRGASEHNLRDLDVRIPLGGMVCLSGPSGSGKSTLADDVLLRALKRHFHGGGETPGRHRAIEGMELLGKVVAVDQSAIGKSPRSNPATFTGMFDAIRDLFAKLPLSRQRGYGAGRFSFNTHGGRCERCEGAGRLKIEMNFLPDAWVLCRSCGGKRFNRETLEVRFKGMSIADALELTAGEALEVFAAVPKLRKTLQVMGELGLGYLRLGQAANTLSGGEAQRLKLALELSKPAAPHTLYFFDEPTTGLHFGDVERLLLAFRGLREAGHSVLVVEHHLDVIAASDWVIDLGPGGGREGGCLVAEGSPREVAAVEGTPTGRALARRYRR
ncbi:MAG: excinuclease ABC subunit A [Verrucomicrobia bacterium]|nr:MAG: excinuclease ABC subunit A [Verrucomicrobiota bacterium]